MGIVNSAFRKFFDYYSPSQKEDIFQQQKDYLSLLLESNATSPLYINSHIKQEDVTKFTAYDLKSYLSQYDIIDYKKHIYPLIEKGSGITQAFPDLHIKTSGTSDAYQGGKLIPTQWKTLKSERFSIERTLYHYLGENPDSKILSPYSFSLTAPFDSVAMQGYISGAMRFHNILVDWMMYPSQESLAVVNYKDKKEKIIQELLDKMPTIRSIHGVPAWPLAIIDDLISRDREKAKTILSQLEYVSIGGGAPHDYKKQYQQRLTALGLNQVLSGSNNHNASEGFFGSQIRNFSDLSFHRMLPVYETNFFLFVPSRVYKERKDGELSFSEALMQSHLLHEVIPGREYFMLFANDRIPRLYDIKDRIIFFDSTEGGVLEYEVVGRYSMSSNIINEHIESDILQEIFDQLNREGFTLEKNAFVAGMELNKNKTAGIFHLIIEGELSSGQSLDILTQRFDVLMGEHNAQWKAFREENEKITDCCVTLRPLGFIRTTMMHLGLAHEQSKIPHLSDHNYEMIVQPLLGH